MGATRAVLEIGLKQREASELIQRIPEFINQIAEAIVEPDPSTESRESTGCQVTRSRLVRVPGQPEMTEVPLTVEGIADETAKIFKARPESCSQ